MYIDLYWFNIPVKKQIKCFLNQTEKYWSFEEEQNNFYFKIFWEDITGIERRIFFENNKYYEWITLEYENRKEISKLNFLNFDLSENSKYISIKIESQYSPIFFNEINQYQRVIDNIKNISNPINHSLPIWLFIPFIFNQKIRLIAQNIILISSVFYFLWTLYQISFSFPNVFNYINKYLSKLFGSYFISFSNNWNEFLIQVDYFIKIAHIGFILNFFRGITNIFKIFFYTINKFLKSILFLINDIFTPIFIPLFTFFYNFIKSIYFSPVINIIKIPIISIKKFFPRTKNINTTYKNSKIIISNLDFLTKPFRLLYTFICLLSGHIYNIIKIIFHKIQQKNNLSLNKKIKEYKYNDNNLIKEI